jgi:ferric-dicitrate binding protein FerR (iron transport regulator)
MPICHHAAAPAVARSDAGRARRRRDRNRTISAITCCAAAADYLAQLHARLSQPPASMMHGSAPVRLSELDPAAFEVSD